jgi:hypothetical protein
MLSYVTKFWRSEVQSCLHVFIVIVVSCPPYHIKKFFLEEKSSANKIFSVFSTEWSLLSPLGHYDLYGRFCLCSIVDLKCVWKLGLNSLEGYTFVHLIAFFFCVFYWHLVWKILNLYYLRRFIIVCALLIYAPANFNVPCR